MVFRHIYVLRGLFNIDCVRIQVGCVRYGMVWQVRELRVTWIDIKGRTFPIYTYVVLVYIRRINDASVSSG